MDGGGHGDALDPVNPSTAAFDSGASSRRMPVVATIDWTSIGVGW